MSEARAKISAEIERLGLVVESQFVPFSQSRHAKPETSWSRDPVTEKPKAWPSLNWLVTLKTKQGRPILTTDYATGVAACPANKLGKAALFGYGGTDRVCRDAAIREEIERGKPVTRAYGHGGWAFGKATIQPDSVDVVWSLVSETDVLDAGGFDEWASGLGYDTDSRKAESTYRLCLDNALKLRAALGESNLQALREACQDY